MAEAWANHLKGDVIEAYSAGTEPKSVYPLAIRVMSEVGFDISQQHSKSIGQLGDSEFDYVITFCDGAQQACPFFPAKTAIVHHGFDDPPKLAEGVHNEDEAMGHYRRVRDEIKAYVEKLPDLLKGGERKA
jgi:arsenate reductase (thioredoxin)